MKTKKSLITKIPIDPHNGSVYQYISEYDLKHNPKTLWRDNNVFDDEFQLVNYHKGRSAVGFICKSLRDKREHSMFISDFVYMIMNATLVNGVVKGKFQYRKQGASYGVFYVGP